MRGRCRLGHRPLLHRLRPTRHGATSVMWRGAGLPEQGDLVGADRALQGDDPLRGTDRDPHLHQVGGGDPRQSDLSSLRLLGSVGEPINPKAWLWYHKVIGGERCPIVDTWWQTETGAIMITPLPGITATSPAGDDAIPGVEAQVVDEKEGKPISESQGLLVLERPWPRCCAASTRRTTASSRPTSRASAGALPGRRRGPPRRRRLLLGDRADRRRRQRLRPPALDRRGRVGDRRP